MERDGGDMQLQGAIMVYVMQAFEPLVHQEASITTINSSHEVICDLME